MRPRKLHDPRSRDEKPTIIVNALDGTTELEPFMLRDITDYFVSGDPELVFRALRFFEVYSMQFSIPSSLAQTRLQGILYDFLAVEGAPDLAKICALRIIGNISDTYSLRYNFAQLIERMWLFVPQSLGAIAQLVEVNEEAMVVILSQPYYNALGELFASEDPVLRSNVLMILKGVTNHVHVLPNLQAIFSMIVTFHFLATGCERIQTFEILNSLVESPEWLGFLISHERIGELFMVEPGNESQLLAALRLLRTILEALPDQNGPIIVTSNTLPLLHAGISCGSGLCQMEACESCYLLLLNGLFVAEILGSGIPGCILQWKDGNRYNVWRKGMTLLAIIFMVGSDEQQKELLATSFAVDLVNNFSTLVANSGQSATLSLVSALLRIILLLKETGLEDDLQGVLGNPEIAEAVDEIVEDENWEDTPILEIACAIQSHFNDE